MSFWTDTGPAHRDDPILFPNVLADALSQRTGGTWEIHTEAHAGWAAPDLRRTLARGKTRQSVGPGTDIIVLGLGTVDAMTAALPGWAMRVLTHVHPRALERFIRNAIYVASPALVWLTGGRLRGTSSPAYRAAWAALVETFRDQAPGVLVVGVLPAPRISGHHRNSTAHHALGVADTLELAATLDVPLLDLPALVRPFAREISAGDGLHWPAQVHRCVAEALADLVVGSGAPAVEPELPAEA